MPHTVESSCFWGLGTQWCTAATKSQNLFLSYVGRSDSDIVLYYIIKKGADARQDAYAKMSVGFIDGEPVLKGESGGVSVNAINNGLTKAELMVKLGDEYRPIMAAMEKHTEKIEGKHPAKRQMETAAKSVELFKKYTRGMDRHTLQDFVKELLKGYDVGREVGIYLATLDSVHSDLRELIATKVGPDVASIILKDDNNIHVVAIALGRADDKELLDTYARNPNELLKRFPKELHRYESTDVYRSIAENPHASSKTLQYIMDVWPMSKHHIVENEGADPEVLISIYEKEPYSAAYSVRTIYNRLANNHNVPSKILYHMLNTLLKEDKLTSHRGNLQLFGYILKNPMLKYNMLRKAALRINDSQHFGEILANPNTTPELVGELFEKKRQILMSNSWTMLRLAASDKTPTKILRYLIQIPHRPSPAPSLEPIRAQAKATLRKRGKL